LIVAKKLKALTNRDLKGLLSFQDVTLVPRFLNHVLTMIVKHAIKTGIAAAILAGIFQNSNLAHIQYPVMGLIATMLSSNLGGNLKAAWGRLGGSVVAGLSSASLISAFGINPITGGVAFMVSSLFCEIYQLRALTAQAGTIAALIAAEPSLGQSPWRYTFDRVVDNGIGVVVATVVTILFWPDNPQQTLQNNLVKILQLCDRLFATLVEQALNTASSPEETDAPIAEIAGIVRQSESLLEQSLYGFAGRQLTQENWSEAIATERKLRRHLWAMANLFKEARQNQLFYEFTTELRQLVGNVSEACGAMVATIQSGITVTQVGTATTIPPLEGYAQKITEQLERMRMTGETQRYDWEDIAQFYGFLHLLNCWTQALDRLAIELNHVQKNTAQPTTPWRFQPYPLPLKQIKHFLKVGVAVGLTLAFVNFTQLSFGYYAVIAVVVAMQPTLGKSIDAGRQRVICTGIGAIVAIVIVNAFGSNPLSVGLGVGLTILLCSHFGFNQGYKVGCFLVAISIMVHGAEPDSYIWRRFLMTFLGCIIALIFSLVIWPETASQKLDQGIAQTFAKLGTLYETIVSHYLQGLDSTTTTAQLSQEIRKSIQAHLTLQAETKLEAVNDFKASKTQQRLNFLISYERTLFSNILSLQLAAGQGDSAGLSQPLREELQTLVRSTVLAFNDFATAVGSQSSQRQLQELLVMFARIEQRIKQLRITRANLKYSVNERIHFYGFLLTMKEIAEDLHQMAVDWPSTVTKTKALTM
jgi:uncharacterized membrane protein YgaE (UPF0421/DUF939 family)